MAFLGTIGLIVYGIGRALFPQHFHENGKKEDKENGKKEDKS